MNILKSKSYQKFWVFVSLFILGGAILSGTWMVIGIFNASDEYTALSHNIDQIFVPSEKISIFLVQPIAKLIGGTAQSRNLSMFEYAPIAFLLMILESFLGGAIFFGGFGALFWYGLYRKKEFLPVAILLLALAYALPYIFSQQ